MTRRSKHRSTQSTNVALAVVEPRDWRAPVGLALILLATLLAYWPALSGGFLWDDDAHVTRPELQSFAGLARIWYEPTATQQYYPLLHSAFWFEHKLWGDSVLGYHAITLAWHLLAVTLLYLVLRKLRVPGALLATAVFALHPVMVESVAWISEQKNTLSAVFYLATMRMYLEFDESRKRSQYAIALALFVLGLLTKTVIATLPAALLVIFWWQRGAVAWKRDVLPLVPFIALGAAAGAVTAWVEQTLVGAKGADFELTLVQRGLLAGRVVWFYLGKLLWPANLIFIYPRWEIDPTAWWQWLFPVATLGVLLALWSVRRKWRGPLSAWLLFVGTLLPVLGFLNVYPFMFSFVADHFQYLASIGIIVLAASGVTLALGHLPTPAQYGVTACVLLVGTLGLLTWRQTRMYADGDRLYETTIERNPGCWMAHYNLGLKLLLRGDQQEAIARFQDALRIKHNDVETHLNLGIALVGTGQVQQGIEHYREAIRLDPKHFKAHNNLGFTLVESGQVEQGIEHCREAIRLKPDFFEAHNNLGMALVRAGQLQQGVEHYREAIRLNPNYCEAHSNFGVALVELGDVQQGIDHYREAIRLNPNYFGAHNNLGNVLMRTGHLPEAVQEFQDGLRLHPDDPIALNNLALALMQMGRDPEAVEHIQHALRINPDHAKSHNNLGVSLVHAGKIPQAIEQFELTLKIDPNQVDAHNNLGLLYGGGGDLQQALAHFEATVRLRPNSPDAENNIGEILRQTGRPSDSIEHFQAALRLKPDYVTAYANMARALSQLNRSAEAIAAAEKGIATARSAGQEAAAQQLEEWLRHFQE